jgi:hypothetical protein
MNPVFKQWIIKAHENLDEESKQNFFRILKSNPAMAERKMSDQLNSWKILAAIELESSAYCIIYEPDSVCRDILQALREHFAKELEGTPISSLL